MARFTVIGVHEGGEENRFAEAYEAADPMEAEGMALADHPALLLAGVAEGAVRMVDDDPACRVETPLRPRVSGTALPAPTSEGALTVPTYLDLSTAHVTKAEMDAIDHSVGDALPVVATYRYGAFLCIPDDDGEDLAPFPAVRAVVELARSLGVRLVRLDADGPKFPGLKTYDW